MSLPLRSSVWSADERTRHRRVGNLLDADGDVHTTPLRGRESARGRRLDAATILPIRPPRRRNVPLGRRAARSDSPSAPARTAPVPSGRWPSTSTSSWSAPGPAGPRPRSPPSGAALASCASTRRTFPRDKTCGDGLTANALRLLEQLGRLGRRARARPSPAFVRETVLVSPTRSPRPPPAPDRRRARRRRDPPRRSTPRSSTSPAAAASTSARQCAVEKVEAATTTEVRAHCSPTATVLDARHVIAADGHWSTGAARARTRRAARPRRVARGAPVLRRRRRRPALGALRTRSPPRLRVGVPAARRRRERRLRRAARRRPQRSRAQGPVARAPRAAGAARHARPDARGRPNRCTRGRSRRATTRPASRTAACSSSATRPASSIR